MTLVELAVVIAILAVLAVMAVPAAGWVLNRSRQTGCVSNLRQIGLALQACMQDNDGGLPAMRAMRTDKSDEIPVMDTVLLPYVQDASIFHCPADDKGIWENSGCSYWWYEMVTLKADGNHNYKVIESVFLGTREPSKIPLALDKEGFHPGPSKINALYADGHAGPLVEASPRSP